MTNGVLELDFCNKSDLIVANFTRLDRSLLNKIVISYAKRNSLALIGPFRATGEQYARILHILTTANPDAPLTRPSTLPREDSAPGSATPPPWQDQLDFPHISDTNLHSQNFNMLQKHALMWNSNLGTVKARK